MYNNSSQRSAGGKYTKAGLGLAVAALLGVATVNYASDAAPSEMAEEFTALMADAELEAQEHIDEVEAADLDLSALDAEIEESEAFVAEREADDYAYLKGLNPDQFQSEHEKALQRAARNMDIILMMGKTKLNADKARDSFQWCRAHQLDYKEVAPSMDFNMLIRDMELQTNRLLKGQQTVRAVGVDLMDNSESSLDNFQGFIETMAEVKEIHDHAERDEVIESAQEMFTDHMKDLFSVTKRSAGLMADLAAKFNVINSAILKTTSRAKEQAGAASVLVKKKVAQINAEVHNLTKQIEHRNAALKAYKLTEYTYEPIPEKLVGKADTCINRNKNCFKLTSAIASSYSSSRAVSGGVSVGWGWWGARSSYASSRHSASSYSSRNDRLQCHAVDDCTKILAAHRLQRDRLNVDIAKRNEQMRKAAHHEKLADRRAKIIKVLKMGLEIAKVEAALIIKQASRARFVALMAEQDQMLQAMNETFSDAGLQSSNDKGNLDAFATKLHNMEKDVSRLTRGSFARIAGKVSAQQKRVIKILGNLKGTAEQIVTNAKASEKEYGKIVWQRGEEDEFLL